MVQLITNGANKTRAKDIESIQFSSSKNNFKFLKGNGSFALILLIVRKMPPKITYGKEFTKQNYRFLPYMSNL